MFSSNTQINIEKEITNVVVVKQLFRQHKHRGRNYTLSVTKQDFSCNTTAVLRPCEFTPISLSFTLLLACLRHVIAKREYHHEGCCHGPVRVIYFPALPRTRRTLPSAPLFRYFRRHYTTLTRGTFRRHSFPWPFSLSQSITTDSPLLFVFCRGEEKGLIVLHLSISVSSFQIR